ncbi:MAG: hypothetical protein DHS20C16_09000 [Phycisphaerae bacterium]|nr:MAG: hypothetical protein DHS20C16_09000 [Phycisphaerae bacterium]
MLVALFGVAMGAGLVTYADDDDDRKKGYDAYNDPKMAAMMKYSSPVPEHGVLRQLEGDWDQQVKWRMGPEKPWVTSESECENEMILGGRFLRQEIESEDDGMKYNAIAYLGYDSYHRKYVGTWVDNMTTMINRSEGSYDPASKMFTFHGVVPDFETGKNRHFRSTLTLHHKDAMTEQMFEPDAHGVEYLSLEIHYKRD